MRKIRSGDPKKKTPLIKGVVATEDEKSHTHIRRVDSKKKEKEEAINPAKLKEGQLGRQKDPKEKRRKKGGRWAKGAKKKKIKKNVDHKREKEENRHARSSKNKRVTDRKDGKKDGKSRKTQTQERGLKRGRPT